MRHSDQETSLPVQPLSNFLQHFEQFTGPRDRFYMSRPLHALQPLSSHTSLLLLQWQGTADQGKQDGLHLGGGNDWTAGRAVAHFTALFSPECGKRSRCL